MVSLEGRENYTKTTFTYDGSIKSDELEDRKLGGSKSWQDPPKEGLWVVSIVRCKAYGAITKMDQLSAWF